MSKSVFAAPDAYSEWLPVMRRVGFGGRDAWSRMKERSWWG